MSNIIGYGGSFSSGKTVSGVKDTIESGGKIISNIELYGIKYVKLTDCNFIKLLADNLDNLDFLKEYFRNSEWFIDEIVNILDARDISNPINALITRFLMLLGKINCNVRYTYQIKDSQVDLRLREIANITKKCTRVLEDGSPAIFFDRIIKPKVMILQQIYTDYGYFGNIPKIELIDPSPYYNRFNTEEWVLLDREYMKAYLKEKIKIRLKNY